MGFFQKSFKFFCDSSLFVSTVNSISHMGVFARRKFNTNELVGCYCGTVFTTDEWDDLIAKDSKNYTENFLFNLNDGANGVFVDGSRGPSRNKVQFLIIVVNLIVR